MRRFIPAVVGCVVAALFIAIGLSLLEPKVAKSAFIPEQACSSYHLSGGTGASTNSNSIASGVHNLCWLLPINTTTTIYYLKMYDSSGAPTCSSATGIKHVFPIPPASASGQAGGFSLPIESAGESYTSGIGFCVTGGGADTDNTNAATGIYIEAGYR